jgi:hypothetical protein
MKHPNTEENSNMQPQTVTFLGESGKVNVFPVVKDYGIYRVLGPTPECEGKYPEPRVGTRLPPMPLSRHKGRELALVVCQLFDDDQCQFFIDYARKDRKQAREAISESNLNMGKPSLEACSEEIKKEIETNGPFEFHLNVDGNGNAEISGLVEEEKAPLGEARFNELELIIHEMEFYGEDTRMVEDDDAEAWKNA